MILHLAGENMEPTDYEGGKTACGVPVHGDKQPFRHVSIANVTWLERFVTCKNCGSRRIRGRKRA